MKRFCFSLCLILAVCLMVGCKPEQAASLQMDSAPSEGVLEMLAAFPSGYREICKQTDLVIQMPHGDLANGTLWTDFCKNVEAGEAAEVVIAQFTTEGDPILYYVSFDGSAFFFVSDSSRDKFGAEPYCYSHTFPYFQSFPDGQLELFVLSDEPLIDLAAYKDYCRSQPETRPVPLLQVSGQ